MGRWFIYAGLLLVVIGLILQFAPNLFNWFGRLPGDINSESENGRVFIPITSMIIISIILTILINIFKR
ncbi:MAG: DUF2905 family protein [Pseudomonadota bacterium]|nr:DUF2905 family protein [Pseudomonadota bacterium]